METRKESQNTPQQGLKQGNRPLNPPIKRRQTPRIRIHQLPLFRFLRIFQFIALLNQEFTKYTKRIRRSRNIHISSMTNREAHRDAPTGLLQHSSFPRVNVAQSSHSDRLVRAHRQVALGLHWCLDRREVCLFHWFRPFCKRGCSLKV